MTSTESMARKPPGERSVPPAFTLGRFPRRKPTVMLPSPRPSQNRFVNSTASKWSGDAETGAHRGGIGDRTAGVLCPADDARDEIRVRCVGVGAGAVTDADAHMAAAVECR